jgi:hypothetical protein
MPLRPGFDITDIVTAVACHALRILGETLPNVENRSATLVDVPVPFLSWREVPFYLDDTAVDLITRGRGEEIEALAGAIKEMSLAHRDSSVFLDLGKFISSSTDMTRVAFECNAHGLSAAVRLERSGVRWTWRLIVAGGKDRRTSTRTD